MILALAAAAQAANQDDAAFMPKANLLDSKAVAKNVLDPAIPAGGILANYRDKQGAYQLILVREPTSEKAAFLLLDCKKVMTEAHYLAHMGGYAGKKNGEPFYVFAKGPFLAVVKDKPEQQADTLARIFAARLPLR